MSRRIISALSGVLAALALVACAATKTSNPLSPSVAGPLPGVNITAPKALEPLDAKIAVERQPVTLLLENASSNGPRPLSYVFEVATDAGFTNKVYVRENIGPGEGGRTSLRLPDPLAAERTYYWRARALDGANEGPYSPAANFDIFTPIVIEKPQPLAPINNVQVDTLRPRFTFINARTSGPVGPIAYLIEVSDSDSFALRVTWAVPEEPGQTSLESPQNGVYSKQLFWHVRAYDPTTTGPWSDTQVFRTPDRPPSPPPDGSPGGGGAVNHVGPGPLTEERARLVVFATANEFPHLTAVFGSEGEAVGAADQLLRRTIWHLQLAGFNAARQRNPSGAISSDKVSIYINGGWHCYDIYSLGVAGRATSVQFIEVPLPNPVADGGIPD